MAKLMPAKKKMTHLYSKNIRIYFLKRKNAIKLLEMKKD